MSLAVQVAPLPGKGEQAAAPARLAYIDNLRWLMIVLVVTIHAAVTYSGMGSWYYKDHGSPSKPTLLFFAFYETHLQAFFMGLLFLIAGYFVPSSFDRKGPGRFMADRAVRLGLPTLIYALLVHPSMIYGMLRVLGTPVTASARDYLRYVFTLGFLSGTGPMWFALALLIFCGFYAAGRLAGLRGTSSSRPLPTHLAVFGLIVVMGAGSFLVRIVQPIGTSVLNMQLCFFTQYIFLFAIGCMARRSDWLNRIPTAFAMPWLIAAWVIGPPLWFLAIAFGGAKTGNTAAMAGGLHWQSAAYCLWESFFCIGMCLGLLTLFRDYFNHQGKLARFLSANAFAVYVFHAPILLFLSLAMRNWHAWPFQKFVALCAMGLLVSFLVAHYAIRHIPGLRRVMA